MDKIYVIEVIRTKKLFSKQKYHWRIKDFHNKEILLSSEKYTNRIDCLEVATKFNKNLKGSTLHLVGFEEGVII